MSKTEHHSEHQEHEGSNKKSEESNAISTFSYVLIGVLIVVILFNQMQLNGISTALSSAKGTAATSGSAPLVANAAGSTGNSSAGTALFSEVIPTGVPAVYGPELGIAYDDISTANEAKANDTIRKLSVYDNGVSLSGEKLQRYIEITTNISCEYCCGAQAITASNGTAACGCAHSAAMRGVAKYLLDKHAGEFTNDQILEELGKWKVLFFPDNMLAKASALKSQNIELNYINLGSNKYRGIEKGATVNSSGGSQVGGC